MLKDRMNPALRPSPMLSQVADRDRNGLINCVYIYRGNCSPSVTVIELKNNTSLKTPLRSVAN